MASHQGNNIPCLPDFLGNSKETREDRYLEGRTVEEKSQERSLLDKKFWG